jgi:hydrogenase maturation protease
MSLASGARMSAGILVAGVGNVLLGDDGFGVEVARRLAAEPLPEGTSVADFGIRGVHLAYQLLEGYDTLILVDALARGQAPGTLYVMEPNITELPPRSFVESHGLDPATVLGMVELLGGTVGRTIVVGCEPADVTERIGLSAPVALAVEEAVRLVRRLVVDGKEASS